MTGKERIQYAIAHKESDIVPFDPYVSMGHALHLLGRQTHEMYTVPGLLPEAMINATRFYKSDICYCRYDCYMGEEYNIQENKTELFFLSKKTGEPLYKVLKDDHALLPVKPADPLVIKDIKEVDKKMPITSAKEIAASKKGEDIKKYRDELGKDTFLFAPASGVTVNAIGYVRGLEQALIDLHLNTDLAYAIMERQFLRLHEHVLAFEAIGIEGYYTGDASASCSLVSPKMFRELLKPYYIRHIKDIKSHGLTALLHICGQSNQILEDIADIAPDIFESLDPPSLGGNVDLADAKRRIGNKVCLKGNLDAPNLIRRGPTEKVYHEALKCCEVAAKGGGYVLSSEQIIPDTPPENVMAMEKARRDFKYF